MRISLSSGLIVLSLLGLFSASGLRASLQEPIPWGQTPALAQPASPAESANPDPCEVDPASPACSTQRLLEQLLQERETRQDQGLSQMLEEFPAQFGYDPRDYQLDLQVGGDTYTIFGKSDWARFRVMPEAGVIEVGHRSATVDAFWGTLVWHDHDVLSVTFTLDENACQVVSDGMNCEFTGIDQIQIGQSFITNHQLIKHGKWTISYIESNQEKSIIFRVPTEALPKGAEDTRIEAVNRRLCRLLPDSLDCQ